MGGDCSGTAPVLVLISCRSPPLHSYLIYERRYAMKIHHYLTDESQPNSWPRG